MTMTFGELVRLQLHRQGLSLSDLAARTGQTRQNLSNKMQRDDFRESEMYAIAAALGCTLTLALAPDGSITGGR